MIKTTLISAVMVLMFCTTGLTASSPVESPQNNQMDMFCGVPQMMFAQIDHGSNHPGERLHGGGKGHRMGGPQGERQRKYIEQLRMLKMLELLDLTIEQETTFLVAFNRFRSSLKQTDDRCMQQLDSLAEGLKISSLSDTEIYRFSEAIIQTKNDRGEVIEKFHNEAKKILSADQYGKLVVFNERFDLTILQQLRAFRGRPGSGGGFDNEVPDPENP